MARTVLRRLTLTDFRSYTQTSLELDGRAVALFGPNGAGKTNLLEAVSYLAPGKGLRGASVSELGRRQPGEATGRAWSVAATLEGGGGEVRVGTGLEAPGQARRTVRMDGETVAPGRLAEVVRLVWLTPAQDRLFLDGGSERRRFLDRLVYAAEPAHATHANAYDKALRERMRLLTEGPADPAWLDGPGNPAGRGRRALKWPTARARTLDALQAEIDGRSDRPFPQARLDLSGDWSRARRLRRRPRGWRDGLRPQPAPRDAAAGRCPDRSRTALT